jgi:hypothetical protein
MSWLPAAAAAAVSYACALVPGWIPASCECLSSLQVQQATLGPALPAYAPTEPPTAFCYKYRIYAS